MPYFKGKGFPHCGLQGENSGPRGRDRLSMRICRLSLEETYVGDETVVCHILSLCVLAAGSTE